MSRLLVLVPDRLSIILGKGECQPNYYNPGNLFEDVDILMTNHDRPDLERLQRMVGDARLRVWNHPDDLTMPSRTRAWLTPRRLRRWAAGGVEIARQIRPALIRCHGADWNTYLAARIKAALGIPYVVSLHINADINPVRRLLKSDLSPAERRHNAFYEYLELAGLRDADLVMPVYQPIVPYLERRGITRYEVCYNILNHECLRIKTDYRLGTPRRLLYVGRLFVEKDPGNIIRAITSMPDVDFTIVGDGPLRPALEALAADLGVAARVHFHPAVDNDALCASLPDYDLFVVHTEFFEISKSVLEALLTGLPVIINRRRGTPVPELEGDIVRFVDDTAEAYRAAITDLLADDDARAALGRRAGAHAQRWWSPAVTTAKVTSVYRRFLDARR